MGAADICGPERGGQAVVRVIGPGQGLSLVVETGHRNHRPEHFAADDFVILLRIGQHRGLKEEAITGHRLATGDQANMRLGDGPLDHGRHPVAVLGSDQRAQFGVRVVLQTVLDTRYSLAEFLHELLVDAALGIDAAGGGAVLACVVEAEGADAFDGGIDIGIVENNHRSLAAQLHVHALHALGGAGDDVGTGGDGTGQRHHAHFRVGNQRRADTRATAKEDIQHAGGKQLGGQLRQAQGGEGCLFRRFEHHGVASGQGRGDLPGDHHQRVVPRGDGGDYTKRVAADHRGMPRQVFTGGRAARATAGTGEEAKHIGNCRDLVVERRRIGFATVVRFQPGQFLAMRFDAVRQFQQQQRAVLGRGLRPAFEGTVGGTHGGIDLGLAGFVDLHQHAAQRRVEYRQRVTFASNQLAIDQQSGLHDLPPPNVICRCRQRFRRRGSSSRRRGSAAWSPASPAWRPHWSPVHHAAG
ncbi:hypothetical protein D3C78_942680 [compost metagenome]